MRELHIAVVGATGVVGEAMMALLESSALPIAQLYPLASHRSAGKTLLFQGRPVTVMDVATFDFSPCDLALFSAGHDVSAHYAPKAVASGCVVIDNTACFRRELTVPLVIPEVNPQEIARYTERKIIANPNCSTIQMLMALKPIYDAVGITRINVSTYQSVSGSGRSGIHELANQTLQRLNGSSVHPKHYAQPIAFNVLPQIGPVQDNGYTHEEMKMHWETQRILNDATIHVNATAVRVPVFYGHSEAIHIETREKITPKAVCRILKKAPGIVLLEEGYATPIAAADQDAVYVSRVRADFSHPRGLNLWVVCDNIRKGAALNAVHIAEQLISTYF